MTNSTEQQNSESSEKTNEEKLEILAKVLLVPLFLILWLGISEYDWFVSLLPDSRPDLASFEHQPFKWKTIEIIDEDRWFVRYNNDVVKDTKTGLEWISGPDRPTTWKEAKKWVDSLNKIEFAGGSWRMPTMKELKTLYKKGAGTRNITPLLKTTGEFVWSGETYISNYDTRDTSLVCFYDLFFDDSSFNKRDSKYIRNFRAFAVRSIK